MSAWAMDRHPGDAMAALMAAAQDEAHSLRQRNRAVWALGQRGDPAVLPLLERLYTGEPCDHDRALGQRELRKAIRLCRGGMNLPAMVNRWTSFAHAR